MNYDKIKQLNITKYGTDIGRIGSLLLANLYSERSHFIFELLQNAEDAYERIKSESNSQPYTVNFHLERTHLEFRHNGAPFDNKDIEGICGIMEEKKLKHKRQIGKFGIGFKSVYAYTTCPEIYSNKNTFCIRNYVWPEHIKPRFDINKNETLIIIPFHQIKLPIFDQEISPLNAFSEIRKKLENLPLITLLFTNNISRINWSIENKAGYYSKEVMQKDGHKWIKLSSNRYEPENYIAFEKSFDFHSRKGNVIIAFKIFENQYGNKKIIPVDNSNLIVFFPTEKETHLQFLIHGTYNTTPTREDILKDDQWNKELIKNTGELLAESIKRIKETGLLNIDLLNILPLNSNEFSEDNSFLSPLYVCLKKLFKSDIELLPVDKDTYTSASHAMISKNKKMQDLLSQQERLKLFKRKNWLHEDITSNKFPVLTDFLISELGIPEIDSKKFAYAIDDSFLKSQTDEWLISFYDFLKDNKRLWSKEYSESYQKESFRYRPIIRLEDNSHISPYDKDQKLNVYLPCENIKDYNKLQDAFLIIKRALVDNGNAKKFFKDLGIVPLDKLEIIKKIILPKYAKSRYYWGEEKEEPKDISEDENLNDIKFILLALDKADSSRKEETIEKINERKIFYCKNLGDNKYYYCSSNAGIYLGKSYTGRDDIEFFLRGNKDFYLLDERYLGIKDKKEFINRFKFCDNIRLYYRIPEKWDGIIVIYSYSGNHKRALNRFDPNAYIPGLEWAVKTINFKKSLFIWNIISKCYDQIKGTVEKSTRKDYSFSKKYETYSEMGSILTDYPWLYKEGDKKTPFLPSKISLESLSSDYDRRNIERIASMLGFKLSIIKILSEHLSSDQLRLIEIFSDLDALGKTNKAVDTLINMINEKEPSPLISQDSIPDKDIQEAESSKNVKERILKNNQIIRKLELFLEKIRINKYK